jgi:hypothetical protein
MIFFFCEGQIHVPPLESGFSKIQIRSAECRLATVPLERSFVSRSYFMIDLFLFKQGGPTVDSSTKRYL